MLKQCPICEEHNVEESYGFCSVECERLYFKKVCSSCGTTYDERAEACPNCNPSEGYHCLFCRDGGCVNCTPHIFLGL